MTDGTGTKYVVTQKALDDPGFLIGLLGPEAAAELTPAAFSAAAVDGFAKRISGMNDEQLRTEFHIADQELIDLMRKLQATCGL